MKENIQNKLTLYDNILKQLPIRKDIPARTRAHYCTEIINDLVDICIELKVKIPEEDYEAVDRMIREFGIPGTTRHDPTSKVPSQAERIENDK